MSDAGRAGLQLHLCVVLWGFTAVLGRLISLPALPLVWWRMVSVTAAVALLPRAWRAWRALPPRLLAAYAAVGGVLALHWLTFYGSIKLANASVGATCMALGPVFLALVEPRLARRAFQPRDLAVGVAALPGAALVVGGVPGGLRAGVAVGAVSALLVAVAGALNKRLAGRADPLAVTGLELGAGALLVTALAPLLPHAGPAFPLPGARDALLLGALALGCTLLPFTLYLAALRHLSAFAAQLAVNLEPVYAVLLAGALLAEHRELTPRFYAGVAVLVGAVLLHPALTRGRRGSRPRARSRGHARWRSRALEGAPARAAGDARRRGAL